MKSRSLTLALAFAGTLAVGAGVGYGLFASGVMPASQPQRPELHADGTQAAPGGESQTTGKAVYTCPMHPQVVSDKPGSCPICGMDLVLKQAAAEAAPETAAGVAAPAGEANGKPVYTCPMHPQVVADTPGQCPICGMDLVLKQTTETPAGPSSSAGTDRVEFEPGVRAVSLSPRQRVLANIETAPVSRQSLSRAVETTGKVTYDEQRLTKLSAWIEGRIDRLYLKTTGATVQKGAVIATLYSPEMLATQQEYLTALASERELARSSYPELRQGAQSLAAASRERLRLMGATDAQIRRLEATRKPLTSFPIVSPVSGVVVERRVQEGQYVQTGEALFDLADYSRVWVIAAIYEADLGTLKPGQLAEVRTTAYPDRVFRGKVSFVQPTLAAESRTGEVRIELANPGGLLKPEMYANVRLIAPVGDKSQLSVPASAVIATGRQHVVYVEASTNQFVPRTVMVGAKAGDRYPVFSGLKEGERVATSGGFLLDASTQLMGGSPEQEGTQAPAGDAP